jgi:hypothetical protein
LKQTSVKVLYLIPALLLMIAIVALLIPNDVIETFNDKVSPTGSIIVFVEDGNTKKPLQFASVTIAETGQSFPTDEYGKTEAMRLPIIEDSEYKGVLPKPWGEITLLVYKEGYIDCAIFHINIWENQTRNGPTVLLFPVSPDDTNQPFTLTEGPNRLWVKQLLDKFRPSTIH